MNLVFGLVFRFRTYAIVISYIETIICADMLHKLEKIKRKLICMMIEKMKYTATGKTF